MNVDTQFIENTQLEWEKPASYGLESGGWHQHNSYEVSRSESREAPSPNGPHYEGMNRSGRYLGQTQHDEPSRQHHFGAENEARGNMPYIRHRQDQNTPPPHPRFPSYEETWHNHVSSPHPQWVNGCHQMPPPSHNYPQPYGMPYSPQYNPQYATPPLGNPTPDVHDRQVAWQAPPPPTQPPSHHYPYRQNLLYPPLNNNYPYVNCESHLEPAYHQSHYDCFSPLQPQSEIPYNRKRKYNETNQHNRSEFIVYASRPMSPVSDISASPAPSFDEDDFLPTINQVRPLWDEKAFDKIEVTNNTDPLQLHDEDEDEDGLIAEASGLPRIERGRKPSNIFNFDESKMPLRTVTPTKTRASFTESGKEHGIDNNDLPNWIVNNISQSSLEPCESSLDQGELQTES